MLWMSNVFWAATVLCLRNGGGTSDCNNSDRVFLGIWLVISVLFFSTLYQYVFPQPTLECFMVKAALVKGGTMLAVIWHALII